MVLAQFMAQRTQGAPVLPLRARHQGGHHALRPRVVARAPRRDHRGGPAPDGVAGQGPPQAPCVQTVRPNAAPGLYTNVSCTAPPSTSCGTCAGTRRTRAMALVTTSRSALLQSVTPRNGVRCGGRDGLFRTSSSRSFRVVITGPALRRAVSAASSRVHGGTHELAQEARAAPRVPRRRSIARASGPCTAHPRGAADPARTAPARRARQR